MAKTPTRPRPALLPVSEEMKAWSAALGGEVLSWSGVSSRPMFGLIAVYRGGKIFAALPKSRGMDSPNSLAFKLETSASRTCRELDADAHIRPTMMQKTRWFTFAMSSDADLNPALKWLNRAYEAVGRVRKKTGDG